MEAKGTTDGSASDIAPGQQEFDAGEKAQDSEASQSDYSLSAMDRQYGKQTSVHRRIHVLGTGSIGKLVAHALRGIADPPPITLLLHKEGLMKAWENSPKEITIRDDNTEIKRKGFDVELLPPTRRQHGTELQDGQADLHEYQGTMRPHEVAQAIKEYNQSRTTSKSRGSENLEGEAVAEDDTIHNLLVTTKANITVAALSSIRHRLAPTSTICFLQNGKGVIDDVNEQLFPNEQDRPNYMQGIITHGVNVPPAIAQNNPFYAVHAGHGTIALSLLPSTAAKKSLTDPMRDSGTDVYDTQSDLWAQSSRYLLRTLTRTPVLCAVGFTPTELLQLQLEKLAVNSVLNPLTVLLDARNGSILYNFAITRTMRLLLAETSLVIRSLPELQNIPNVATRFSAQRLETLVVSVANTTRDNISSMLADVRGGRQTEVEYINGYIVKRGEEIGIKCVVNYAIMQTVIGKSAIVQREVRGEYASDPVQSNDS